VGEGGTSATSAFQIAGETTRQVATLLVTWMPAAPGLTQTLVFGVPNGILIDEGGGVIELLSGTEFAILQTVPEPTALAMLVLAAVFCRVRRCKTTKQKQF